MMQAMTVEAAWDLAVQLVDYVYPIDPLTHERSFHFTPLDLENWLGDELFQPFVESCGGKVPRKYIKYDLVLNRVGRRLDRRYEFCVINSWEMESRYFPGRKIGITLGLLNALENDTRDYGLNNPTFEDKIAVILSHSIVHVEARHYGKMMEIRMYLAGLILGIGFALSYLTDTPVTTHALALIVLSGIGTCSTYQHELTADRCGHLMLKKTSFSPDAVQWVQKFYIFQKMRPQGGISGLFHYLTSTHPTHAERLKQIQMFS